MSAFPLLGEKAGRDRRRFADSKSFRSPFYFSVFLGVRDLRILRHFAREQRQLTGVFFLFVMASSLVVPLLSLVQWSPLPVCCRKGGEHHCAIQSPRGPAETQSGRASLVAKVSICPYRSLTVMASTAPMLATLSTWFLPPPAERSPEPGELTVRGLFFSDFCSERGPPYLL